MRTINPTPTAARQHFQIGDIITVHTFDKTVYEFKMIDITEDAIVGQRQQILFSDIQKLEKKKIGMIKSVGAGIGITFVTLTGLLGLHYLFSGF
jgi:hypothetical protein